MNPRGRIRHSMTNPTVRVQSPVMGSGGRGPCPKSEFNFFFERPKIGKNWSKRVNETIDDDLRRAYSKIKVSITQLTFIYLLSD